MNTTQAQNLMARYRLTHEKPFTQPPFLIAYAMANMGIPFLESIDWVTALYREDCFPSYNGTWADVMSVICMYTKAVKQ